MTKDFYNHMKEEQKLLYHSYQESLRQKNERMHGMDVWEPDDKTAENSQIKKNHKRLVSGFKDMGGTIHPGVLVKNG